MNMENTMRVGVDACALGYVRTGVANYLIELLEPLCRQNTHVTFIFYSNDEIFFPSMPNVLRRTSRPKLRGPLWLNFQLVRMIREDKLDVFWGTNGMLPMWGMRRLKQVLTVHDLAEIFAPATQQLLVRWNRRFFQSRSVKRADACMAVSGATSNDMLLHYGRKADIVINPFAASRFRHVDVTAIDAIREEFHLPKRFWLSVGTLEPRKNLSALMRAHHACIVSGMDMPLLVLAGGGGWRNEAIEELIKKGESEGTIRRLGFVKSEQLPALYACSEVFFMVSLYEGFGMPILEAQMCGAAVVHGNHPAMIEASGGIGLAVSTSERALQQVLTQIVKGEAPIACRLTSDRSIQAKDHALVSLQRILGIFNTKSLE